MNRAPISAITARIGPSFSSTAFSTLSTRRVYTSRDGPRIAVHGLDEWLASVGNHRERGCTRCLELVAVFDGATLPAAATFAHSASFKRDSRDRSSAAERFAQRVRISRRDDSEF